MDGTFGRRTVALMAVDSLFLPMVIGIFVMVVRATVDDLAARVTADRAVGYRTVATVSGIRYEPPRAGVFSSREGYWEVHLEVGGGIFTLPVTEAVASSLKAGDEVAVTAYPCGDRSRGVCDVILADVRT